MKNLERAIGTASATWICACGVILFVHGAFLLSGIFFVVGVFTYWILGE